VGLGPVGLATMMLAKAMGAQKIIGVESNQYRIDLAKKLGLGDLILKAGPNNVQEIKDYTNGKGVERAFDASASDPGRQTAIRATRQWGKIAFVGEGGTVNFNPSPDIIHDQKTIYGSWVTSVWLMENLVEQLVRWNMHPDALITHRFPLDKADEAYDLMDKGNCGKVAVVADEELK
jgi:threonine dehydrogenase-like Zn-dependent dehydrogenase